MTQVQSSQAREHPHPVYTSDDIDMRQLMRALWRYRVAGMVVALLGALVGAGISVASTRYVSQGLFLTPNLTLGEYKQYEAALSNEPRLQQFLKLRGITGTRTAEILRGLVRRPEAMAEAVRPVFAITGKDAKDYGIKLDDLGGMVGIQLTLERGDMAEEAPVMALAEYLRGTAISVDLKEAVLNRCLQFQIREEELRNEQLQSDFDIRQEQSRADSLRKLIASIPGADRIDSRQVITLDKGSERFLSPTAQLVAAEVAISDMRIVDAKRVRERTSALLRAAYYCKARETFEQAIAGPDFLEKLGDIRAKVFEGQDLSVDIVEQTANEFDIQRKRWMSEYLEQMRFVVPPEGAEFKRRRPSLMIGVLLGGLLGAALGVLLALLLAWWHDNREAVMVDDNA